MAVAAFALLIPYHVGMYYVTWDWHVKSPAASDAIDSCYLVGHRLCQGRRPAGRDRLAGGVVGGADEAEQGEQPAGAQPGRSDGRSAGTATRRGDSGDQPERPTEVTTRGCVEQVLRIVAGRQQLYSPLV